MRLPLDRIELFLVIAFVMVVLFGLAGCQVPLSGDQQGQGGVMTRNEIFWLLLITVVMTLAGWREASRNAPLATLLIAIPICGWIALYLGR